MAEAKTIASKRPSQDGMSSLGGSSDWDNSLSSAGGSSRVKSAEESLFSVLFTLTQHGKSGKLVPFASFIIDFLQMIGFVFSKNFPWGSLTQNTVSKLVSVVQMQVPSLTSGYYDFLIIFWFVVAVIVFAMADVAFVSHMFKKNEFNYMWPVKFLRFFVSLLVTVFFIPFFNVLLFPLDCHYNTDPPGLDSYPDVSCWSIVNGFHSGVAIVAAVAFALFSLTVVLVFVDPDPTANQPLSTPHSFFDLILLISRIILSLASTFLSQHVGWLAAINFVIHASAFAAVVYMCPYFMLVVTRLRSGFFAVLAFASAILVGVVQTNNSDSEAASYVFLAGFIPSFCLGYWLPLWRLKRLCRKAVHDVKNGAIPTASQRNSWYSPLVQVATAGSSWVKKMKEEHQVETSVMPGASHSPKIPLVFKSIIEVELATRFLQHDTSAECLEMAEKIFERGNTMFPNTPLLLLMHASFAQFYLKNLQLAQSLVEKAHVLNPYFGFRFLVYRKRREMFTKGEVDMVSAVDFKRHYAGAHKSHLMCVKAMVRLWRHLLPNKVNVVALPEILEKIYQTEERAELHFKHLLRKYKNPRVLRAYGSFLADCKNNQGMAMKYFAAAEDMEEEGDYENEAHNEKSPAPITDEPVEFVISGQDTNAPPSCDLFNVTSQTFLNLPVILLGSNGEVMNMSPPASDFLSLDIQSSIGQKLSALCMCQQSTMMFEDVVESAMRSQSEQGIPTLISEGFLVFQRNFGIPQDPQISITPYPICYQLIKLVFEHEVEFSFIFDRAQMAEKQGEAKVLQETFEFGEADEGFASVFGCTSSELVGSNVEQVLTNVGCQNFTDGPQLIFTEGSSTFCHLLTTIPFESLEISEIPHEKSNFVSLFLYPLFISSDSPVASDFISMSMAGSQSAQGSVAGGDGRNQVTFGNESHAKEAVMMRKRKSGPGSVASSDLSYGGGMAGIQNLFDDGMETRKKSTVAIFHRNIRIGLVVVALFAVASFITIQSLSNQTAQTLSNERDAGMLSTLSQRMTTHARTIEISTSVAEIQSTQAFLLDLQKEFYDTVYEVYYLGDQAKFQELHDIYYNPTVLLHQLSTQRNVSSEMSSVWVVERLFAYHAKVVATLPLKEFRYAISNASFFFVATNGPYGVKDALGHLTRAYRDFSLASMEQIRYIEATVQSASIAVLIGLVVVVQMSLRLVHKDKVHSIDLFLMIPKHVIQELLNRKYCIIDEINELRSDPDRQIASSLWANNGTPNEHSQTMPDQKQMPHAEKDQQELIRLYLPSDLPPLPPIPPTTIAQQQQTPTSNDNTDKTIRFMPTPSPTPSKQEKRKRKNSMLLAKGDEMFSDEETRQEDVDGSVSTLTGMFSPKASSSPLPTPLEKSEFSTSSKFSKHQESAETSAHNEPSTQKIGKNFEKALASPAVLMFTRRYGLIVAGVAALLVTSFVLGFQSIAEAQIICHEIDLSSARSYLSLHIRHLARELILSKSSELASHIKETIHELLSIHSALLYGNAAMGVPGSALRYPPQEHMLYSEGCFREDITLCPKPTDPYYTQLNAGLATLLRDFLENFNRLADSPPQELTMTNPYFDFVFNKAIKNVRDGLQILTDIYLQEAKSILSKSVDTQLYITLGILFLLVSIYFIVFRPMIKFIRDETRRTCTMLLMLPSDLVNSMTEIRTFILDKSAELTENKAD